MFRSRRPSKQYELSSMRVVSRFAAQDSFCATQNSEIEHSLRNSFASILVIAASSVAIVVLYPRFLHLASKNKTFSGAINSCSVQPRVNLRSQHISTQSSHCQAELHDTEQHALTIDNFLQPLPTPHLPIDPTKMHNKSYSPGTICTSN
jgi:hypothetical protein